MTVKRVIIILFVLAVLAGVVATASAGRGPGEVYFEIPQDNIGYVTCELPSTQPVVASDRFGVVVILCHINTDR